MAEFGGPKTGKSGGRNKTNNRYQDLNTRETLYKKVKKIKLRAQIFSPLLYKDWWCFCWFDQKLESSQKDAVLWPPERPQ